MSRTTFPCPQCDAEMDDITARRHIIQLGQECRFDNACVRKGLVGDKLAWCPGEACNYVVVVSDDCEAQPVPCTNPSCTVQIYCSACQTHLTQSVKGMSVGRHKCKDGRGKIRGVTLCPGCQAPAQLADGCNDVRCWACGTRFCHQCGELITGEDHYTSISGCSFFSQHAPWHRWRVVVTNLLLVITSPIIAVILIVTLPPTLLLSSPFLLLHMRQTGYWQSKSKPLLQMLVSVLPLLIILPVASILITLVCTSVYLLYVWGYVPLTWMKIYILSYIQYMFGDIMEDDGEYEMDGYSLREHISQESTSFVQQTTPSRLQPNRISRRKSIRAVNRRRLRKTKVSDKLQDTRTRGHDGASAQITQIDGEGDGGTA